MLRVPTSVGLFFTKNTVYSFKDGKVDSFRPFVHPLMILGFDIYKLPMAEVLEVLKGLKFDSEMRADVSLDGKLFDPQYWTSVHWKE